MSTPNAHLHAASKPTQRSTGTVFTPSASSPSRSVPSPAHLNASNANPKAGKSPHKNPHSAQFPYAGSNTNIHTPTALGAATSSPAAMESLHRARASTMGAKSIAGSEANTPAMSGLTGLGLYNASGTLSDTALIDVLGGEEGQGIRTAEQFTQRTRGVVELLATRWGRVSQESLVASVPRLGLEGMWEDGLGDTEVKPGQSRSYIIAGKGFSVEVEWLEGRVKGVVLDLPNARGNAKRSLGRAAEILRKDLDGDNKLIKSGRYVDLKPFANNMQRLAITDQLGLEKASCFEALEGLFASLSKIWDWEVATTREKSQEKLKQKTIELEVLCHRSGRPTMHADGKIGLKLDYWLDRRLAVGQDETKMGPEFANERWGEDDNLWSLLIECQACDPTQYPPIRISDSWVGADVGKEADSNTTNGSGPTSIINWQEPPIMIISGSELSAENDPMDIDVAIQQAENSTQPTVRFVAKFDPPLTMPYSTAAEIYQLIGQQLAQEPLQSYTSLLFPEKTQEIQTQPEVVEMTAAEASLSFHRLVNSFDVGDEETPHRRSYSMFTQPNFYGRTVHEIPFSHPSQLVTILPFLRQWAYFGQLLRRTVGAKDKMNRSSTTTPLKASEPSSELSSWRRQRNRSTQKAASQRPDSPPSDTDSDNNSDSASDLPTSSSPSSISPLSSSSEPFPSHFHHQSSSTDLTLSYSPLTALRRIDLDCTSLYNGRRAMLRVLPNAHLEIDDGETTEQESDNGAEAEARRAKEREVIRKAVNLTEDLGLVGVWWETVGKDKASVGSRTEEGQVRAVGGKQTNEAEGGRRGERGIEDIMDQS